MKKYLILHYLLPVVVNAIALFFTTWIKSASEILLISMIIWMVAFIFLRTFFSVFYHQDAIVTIAGIIITTFSIAGIFKKMHWTGTDSIWISGLIALAVIVPISWFYSGRQAD